MKKKTTKSKNKLQKKLLKNLAIAGLGVIGVGAVIGISSKLRSNLIKKQIIDDIIKHEQSM